MKNWLLIFNELLEKKLEYEEPFIFGAAKQVKDANDELYTTEIENFESFPVLVSLYLYSITSQCSNKVHLLAEEICTHIKNITKLAS